MNVLDEFHLRKYLLKMTAHMKDSAEDARKELNEAIKAGIKAEFRNVVKRIIGCAKTEGAEKRTGSRESSILSFGRPDYFG